MLGMLVPGPRLQRVCAGEVYCEINVTGSAKLCFLFGDRHWAKLCFLCGDRHWAKVCYLCDRHWAKLSFVFGDRHWAKLCFLCGDSHWAKSCFLCGDRHCSLHTGVNASLVSLVKSFAFLTSLYCAFLHLYIAFSAHRGTANEMLSCSLTLSLFVLCKY